MIILFRLSIYKVLKINIIDTCAYNIIFIISSISTYTDSAYSQFVKFSINE